MGNWKIWTVLGSVFISGIIVGVVGLGMFMQHSFKRPKDEKNFRAMMKARMLEEIVDEVHPDPAVVPEIAKILDDVTMQLHEFRKENRPRFKAIFHSGSTRIKGLLTPAQATLFDKMIENRRKGNFGFLRLPPLPPPPMP